MALDLLVLENRWQRNNIYKRVNTRRYKITQGYNLQERDEIHREEYDIAKSMLGTRINPAEQMTHIDSKNTIRVYY